MIVLHWVDYFLFVLFIAITLLIGLYFYIHQQKIDASGYIYGGRRLPILPTAISLVASYQSAITLLGSAAEVYMYGIRFAVFTLIYFFMATTVSERLLVPWIYRLKIVSINEVP